MFVNVLTAVKDPEDNYFTDFEDQLISKNKGFCIYRLNNHTNIKTIQFRMKIYNTILLDSLESFLILNKNIKSDDFNFRGFFLFVLIIGNEQESHTIFREMWKKNVINVNVIYVEEGVVKLATIHPFKAQSCGDTTPIEWDRFGNGSFSREWKQIFPDKLTNLYQCPIRSVAFDRCPASCVESRDGRTIVSGFDISILKLITELLNFKNEIKVLFGPEQWRTVFGNGSATGASRSNH